jgi:DnaJ-class molecular chaperone
MEDFYKLFNLSTSSSLTEIMSAYQTQISKYNNLTYISDTQAKQIKEFKRGLYILTNPNLKKIYDEKLFSQNNTNEIKCANIDENETSLDTLFSCNSLLSNKNNNNSETTDTDKHILGERIFSLSHMNKIPELNNFSLELRKPLTGRINKTIV